MSKRQSLNILLHIQNKRPKKIIFIIIVLLVASIGTYLLIGSHAASLYSSINPVNGTLTGNATILQTCAGSTSGSCVVFRSGVPLGLYSGPANVSSLNNFSTWLGAPITYVTDYVDYKNGWSVDFNPTWIFNTWGPWVKANSGRRLVLGLPMLENSNPEQFSQGTAGAFDAYFLSLSQKLVSNNMGNTIIRLGYEANNPNIGPWEACADPSGYIADWRHIVNVMKSVPGQNFEFDWNPTESSACGNQPLNSFASFYPGDDVVNIIGLDQYDIKWMDTTSTPQQRWQFFLNQPMGLLDHKNFAIAHKKMVSFPEWGLYASGDKYGGGGDDPYYIDQMHAWFTSNNTAYQSYFNLNWGGGILSNFLNGQARYKSDFGP